MELEVELELEVEWELEVELKLELDVCSNTWAVFEHKRGCTEPCASKLIGSLSSVVRICRLQTAQLLLYLGLFLCFYDDNSV